MLTEDLRDKLTETLAICDLHHERMMFKQLLEALEEDISGLPFY